MNSKSIAIFDSEERYAMGFLEYFEEKTNIPLRIHVFTDKESFFAYDRMEQIDCLVVAENVYEKRVEEINIPHIIILSQSQRILNSTLHHINKYQPMENIYREILEYFADSDDNDFTIVRKNVKRMKIIGVYTPIGRCLQTTFAITLGQILSKEHKTLYMNFEQYSGLSMVMKKQFNSDISDLMFYYNLAKEKLTVRLNSIVENVNGLDFVPPVFVYQNLAGIKGEQWIDLFMEMEKSTEYEYLILDMTDGMLDLWDVLRFCDVIYTIYRADTLAMAKLQQYESAIQNAGYPEVLRKTRKYNFPIFKHLPQKFDELTKSDLAAFIHQNILPGLFSLEDGKDE